MRFEIHDCRQKDEMCDQRQRDKSTLGKLAYFNKQPKTASKQQKSKIANLRSVAERILHADQRANDEEENAVEAKESQRDFWRLAQHREHDFANGRRRFLN